MSEPVVSVIVAVHNGEAYLEETIQSVLAQTYSLLECIVVDDGSSDNTPQILARYADGIVAMAQPQAGAAAARNRGIGAARGEYLAFLDADDTWHPTKLARQMAVLESSSELDASYALVQHYTSPELDDAERRSLHCPADPMPGYLLGTLVVRRTAFDRVGLLTTEHELGEFIDWYARAIEAKLKSSMLDTVLLYRRLHLNNIGITKKGQRGDYVQIVKAVLDRRRASESP